MNLTVIGSINTDLVINTPRIPKTGETITGNGFQTNCGGKGANQAVAAAKLGGNVTFIGAVGNDSYGDISIENLNSNNIITDRIVKTTTNTGVAVITICNGDNTIILDSGANSLINKEIIDKNSDVISGADAIIMQLEIPLETVVYAATVAHNAGVKVILNPAPVTDLPKELLENTDILILNETETEYLTKIYPDSYENRKLCINILKNLGINQVIITLGADGSVYNDGDEIKHQPAFKTNVVDTTAAGDTFIGAFCMKLSQSLEYAIKYATAASSITVSRHGASCSIPNQTEVENTLKEFE